MSIVTERPMPPPSAGRSRPWRLLGAILVGIDLLIAGATFGDTGARIDGGIVFAANTTENPILFLGSTFDRSGCQTVPLAIGSGFSVFCEHWSATTSVDYSAQVVSLYAAGNAVVDEYTGPMPRSLRWHEGLQEVLDTLGDPQRVTAMYGTPTLVYMYTRPPYGSLELQFDADQELVRINACLAH
jgi:hypothetical protein